VTTEYEYIVIDYV